MVSKCVCAKHLARTYIPRTIRTNRTYERSSDARSVHDAPCIDQVRVSSIIET